MVKIVWLIAAKNDLKDIYIYISKDSKIYAKRQVDKILKATQIIKKQILIGRIVAEINNSNIREIIEGNYRIIYEIKNKNLVYILMIHHGARNLKTRIE